MRLVVISDIQGNAVALESVLQRIKKDAIDQIVCLGDVASGPEPVRVLDLLHINSVLCIKGNMDEVILQPTPYSGDDEDAKKYSEMDQWCHEQLSEDYRLYLNSFPLTRVIQLKNIQCLCFHGSPKSTDAVISATTPEEQLTELLGETQASIFLTGHLHRPMLRAFWNGFVINPGSLGLPFGGKQQMPMVAEYAVIDVEEASYSISFHQTHYDAQYFRQRLLKSGIPHASWYLSKWKVAVRS